MKIYLNIPGTIREDNPTLPYYMEGPVAPRAGEYLTYSIPLGLDDQPEEVFFRIVRVAYSYGDEQQMEVYLSLKQLEGTSLDSLSEDSVDA